MRLKFIIKLLSEMWFSKTEEKHCLTAFITKPYLTFGHTIICTQKFAPPLNVFTKFQIEINMVLDGFPLHFLLSIWRLKDVKTSKGLLNFSIYLVIWKKSIFIFSTFSNEYLCTQGSKSNLTFPLYNWCLSYRGRNFLFFCTFSTRVMTVY